MEVVFGLIPMMLIFGFLTVMVFIWMAKTGHFDDLDGAAHMIFMDDEYPEDIENNQESKKVAAKELASDVNDNNYLAEEATSPKTEKELGF